MVENELTLATGRKDLETALAESTDLEEIQKIINLFNVDLKKRDILRRNKINDAQDTVLSNINRRLECDPETFSNNDLINCFKVMQSAASSAETLANTPAVQLTQVNIDNSTNNGLDRASRARVNDVISQILNDTTKINGDD